MEIELPIYPLTVIIYPFKCSTVELIISYTYCTVTIYASFSTPTPTPTPTEDGSAVTATAFLVALLATAGVLSI